MSARTDTIRTTRVPALTGAQSQRSDGSVTLMVRQEITASTALLQGAS